MSAHPQEPTMLLDRLREFIERWQMTTHAFDTDEVAEFIGLFDALDTWMEAGRNPGPIQWEPHACRDCNLAFESPQDVTQHLLVVHAMNRRASLRLRS